MVYFGSKGKCALNGLTLKTVYVDVQNLSLHFLPHIPQVLQLPVTGKYHFMAPDAFKPYLCLHKSGRF